MPTTPNQEASMSPKPPSPRQLSYLKALARRTGQSFTWPKTSAQASREIQRLKRTRPSTKAELAIERFGDTQAIEAAQDAASIQGFEVVGYGSHCTWSQRS
jgi:hypothetical protein